MGHLDRRAGDFAAGPAPERVLSGTRGIDQLLALADRQDKITDPVLRDGLMRLHSYHEIARCTALRSKAAKAAGRGPGPEANTAKLAMSRITRLQRELSLAALGPHGTLFGRDAPDGGITAGMALFSPAVSIYAGSDEIQRNIIGERVLGLPGEPRVDKELPFSQIPKNERDRSA